MIRLTTLFVCLVALLGACGDLSLCIGDDDAQEFPPELVNFTPYEHQPVFAARGKGHWDVKIRERGWILHEGDTYRMWFTGYDGSREGMKQLGYAVSADGINWKRHDQPIFDQVWTEDMMIVKQSGTYYLFAEGAGDIPFLLVSQDGLSWTNRGKLDVRYTNGQPLSAGPYGTPTAYYEDGIWYLFYERLDQGVWLATSKDMKIWKHVQDEPVLSPGPADYDGLMIALNQIVKYRGRYYAYYHGTGSKQKPRDWCTAVAVSDDLIHWRKYSQNPLLKENQSSGILVNDDNNRFRLYSMHGEVHLHLPTK